MRPHRHRRATLLSLLLAAALCAGAPDARAGTPAAPRVRLLAAGLESPREHPRLLARVRSAMPARVTLRLLGGDGRALARTGALRLRAGRARTVTLRLSGEGARRLGVCRVARLRLVAHASGGKTGRTSARTRLDPLRCGPLRWPPPTLDEPTTIRLGTGFSDLHLEPGRDYVLKLPRTRKLGGAFIEGGRNVVVIGGWISLPRDTTSDQQRRALYFKGQTGTVHVEGVLIDGSGGGEGDGIAINAPQAAVQIENTRIVGLHGSEATTHADVVQPWGGVRALRIDRLTGSSAFQGLQLPVALGPIGSALVRYVDLRALPAAPGHGGGHMLWLTPPHACGAGYPVALDQVWVSARPGRALANTVWPGVGDGSACAAAREPGGVGWPRLPVRGVVRAGAPRGGDFVPRWTVGVGYRSPGYGTPANAAAATAAPAALDGVAGALRGLVLALASLWAPGA
ncbi:MAG TPA: hypothetical protein VF250_05025 [Conexibacter sp.]